MKRKQKHQTAGTTAKSLLVWAGIIVDSVTSATVE